MNQCPHCPKTFTEWMDYHEHITLAHYTKVLIEDGDLPKIEGIKLYSSGRTDLAPSVYQGPMDKDQKAKVVMQGERRLGLHHFYPRSERV